MTVYLRMLWRAKEIISHLVRREVKVRYKGSALGFFWSFLRPLGIMAILTVVFSSLLRFEIDYEIACRLAPEWTKGSFPIFLLLALIPWFFTIGGLNDAVGSLLNNAALIRKVAVPGEVFPLSAVLANLVNFLLSLLILLPVLFIFFEVPLHRYLLLLPFLICIQLVLTCGISFILSIGNVFFRDVAIIFELVSMMWFYMTPIFYPLSMVHERLTGRYAQGTVDMIITCFMLNPMAVLVTAYRSVILHGVPVQGTQASFSLSQSQKIIAVCSVTGWTVLTVGMGIWLFQRYRKQIPDEL